MIRGFVFEEDYGTVVRYDLREAAALGVWLHGCAGDAAARKVGEASVMAGKLLEEIPGCIRNDSNDTEEGKV